MINWWNGLDLKGRMYFWGFFGLGVNLVLYFFGMWMPLLLASAIASLVVGFLIRSDTTS